MIRTICIVDVETTGLEPGKDQVIELGAILWSVEHCTMIEAYSRLLPAQANAAEAVNGIPAGALSVLQEAPTWDGLLDLAGEADALVAHNAAFDRAFIDRAVNGIEVDEKPFALGDPWICTIEDFVWPRAGGGNSLIAIALTHGCAVVAAHRAINDCLLLVRLFESLPDIALRLTAAREHAKLPKNRHVALVSYEDREKAKVAGFSWEAGRKEWHRTMADVDAAKLPFRTRVVNL